MKSTAYNSKNRARISLGGGVILFIIQVFNLASLNAQMLGWPNFSHGSTTINNDVTWCTDRCRVNSISGSGVYTLSITNFEGSFTNGDWAMLIRMDRSSQTSNHTMVEITSSGTITPTSTTIEVKPYSNGSVQNGWPSWDFSLPYYGVQLVKVARFWDLTINSGVITCPAFDQSKGTGGILAILVGNNFTMNGGYFTTHGKGYHTFFPTGQKGAGGPGTSERNIWVSSGGTSGGLTGAVNSINHPSYPNRNPIENLIPGQNGNNLGSLCLLNAGITNPFATTNNGQSGGAPDNSQIAGSVTTGEVGSVIGHGSIYQNVLWMGCAGAKSGIHGGEGAGGGGYGGNGGAGNIPISGTLGSSGSAGLQGEAGGDAGNAGVGGGILYLKVANSFFNLPNSNKRFFAGGTNGENGKNGGDGGEGGNGGEGCDGGCNGGLITPGGWGGFGGGGIGAGGGDGGYGACGGPIWIFKKTGGTHVSFANYITSQPGIGGDGGAGGYTPNYVRAPNARNFNPPLISLPCNPGGGITICYDDPCIPLRCDCNEVFRHIGQDMTGTVSYNNSSFPYKIEKAGTETVYWTPSALSYTRTTNGCATKYECKMIYTSLFNTFMNKIFGKANLTSYDYFPLNIGANQVGFAGNNTQISVNGHKILEYNFLKRELTDFDDIKNAKVTPDDCGESYSLPIKPPSISGARGVGGLFLEPEVILIKKVPTGTKGNAGEMNNGDGSGFIKEEGMTDGPPPIESKSDIDNQLIYLNTSDVGFENYRKNESQCFYYLFDLAGKLVFHSNGFIINDLGLKSGFYVLIVKSNNKTIRQKVFVQ